MVQIEDTQQNQVGWLFGRGGELLFHILHIIRAAAMCRSVIVACASARGFGTVHDALHGD